MQSVVPSVGALNTLSGLMNEIQLRLGGDTSLNGWYEYL